MNDSDMRHGVSTENIVKEESIEYMQHSKEYIRMRMYSFSIRSDQFSDDGHFKFGRASILRALCLYIKKSDYGQYT